jgi:hypothetical protein
MAVTPYSTPIKTEYKPMGFEAFAQPLSAMQAQYDTTKTALDSADFALARLGQDDERAAERVRQAEEDRDALVNNLMSTGNYRQAAQKLIELNKQYNKSDENQAIKGNYEKYQAAKKEFREKVDKGYYSETDFKLWDFKTRNEFKGTNYDSKSGDYTAINTNMLSENKEKEMMDMTLKLASMTPAQSYETLENMGMIDPFTKRELQRTIEYKDRDQIAGEIERFIRNSDQFKDFNRERGDLEWYYNTANDPEFQDKFVDQSIGLLDGQIQSYTDYAAKTKDAGQKKQAAEMIANLQKQRQDLITGADQSMQDGTYDKFAKNLWMQQVDGKFGRLSFGAADVIDYNRTHFDITDTVDEVGKKKATDAIAKLEEVGTINTNIVESTYAKGTQVLSGQSTSTFDINAKIMHGRTTYETMINQDPDKVPGIENLSRTIDAMTNVEYKNTLKLSQQTTADLYGINVRLSMFQDETKNLNDQISLKADQLAKAQSQPEKDRLKQEISDLQGDVEENRLAISDETKTLDNIVDAQINASYVTPELKKKYQELYDTNPTAFFRSLREASARFTKGAADPSGTYAVERDQKILEWEAANNKSLTEAEKEAMFGPIVNPITMVGNVTPPAEVQFANDIMQAYRQSLYTSFYAIGQEVIIDKGASAMTDGQLSADGMLQYIYDNARGASDVKEVSLNVLTGETKERNNGGNFDLKGCYTTTPHYVGIAENGEVIFRYALKPEFAEGTVTANTAIAQHIKTKKGLSEAETYMPSEAEKKEFWNANPTNLYITVPGTSFNPTAKAQKNFIEIGQAALVMNDVAAFTQNMQNYATFHIGQSAATREAYYKMAFKLEDAMQEGHVNTELIQAPAHWNDNGNGTFTGYSIDYKVVDGKVIATINQGLRAQDGSTEWKSVAQKDLMQEYQNLPTALAAMDIIYGTGREADVVKDAFNTPFVPVFQMPQLFK